MMHAENKRQALVVEDSPTQAERLKNLMETHGMECSVADDGQAGLDLAASILPDVIILDLELPQFNGFQVCQMLKANPDTAHIPVILMTGHGEAEMIKLSQDLGAVEFIAKDAFADAVLVETLKQMRIIQ